MKYLILLETSGNQRYIFSTNKLRENIGASELTYQIGAIFTKDLAEKIPSEIEPIITTSGKALLLVDNEKLAKAVVQAVTKHALLKMPGLTVHGAICKVEDEHSAENLQQAISEVHHRLEEIRHQVPSNLQRFQRLPFAAECASSNLPAQDVKIFYERRNGSLQEVERKVFSQPISTKRNALVKPRVSSSQDEKFNKSRIVKMLEDDFGVTLFEDLEELEKKFEKKINWLAVVHADGNGLGEIFLKFDKFADMSSGTNYRKDYKEFSDAIDVCTKNAFGNALKKLQTKFPNNQIPVVPLILGGDDLTFICDAEYAVNLTEEFLRNFETENSTNEVIKRLTKDTTLGICAGIAITKPHFPFHQSYALAEELLQSAKKSKQISHSLSAFDYHVLYDSSSTKLEEIRGKTPFVARPYIVTPKVDAINLAKKNVDYEKWIENHHFCELAKRVEVISARDDDNKNKLPNSQLHILREGLYVAKTTEDRQEEVDARARLIEHRYETFKQLYVQDGTLFFDALLFDKKEDEKNTKLTHFLDALDIVKFWK
ncbi:MAG: hypothetical protein ABWZ66_03905 [Pyrinomonadaceae bacterium]